MRLENMAVKKKKKKRVFHQPSNQRLDGAETENRQRGNILADTELHFRCGREGSVTLGYMKLLQFIEMEVVSSQKRTNQFLWTL